MKKPIVASEPIRSEKQYWTVKDAARYLGMRDQTIYSWLNPESQLRPSKLPAHVPPPPVYRFGTRGGIRFPIKAFLKWVENFKLEQH
jgi:hypothetical protein